MKTPAHQRRAAEFRHAKTNESKHHYFLALASLYRAQRPRSMRTFISSQRAKAMIIATRYAIRPSTVWAWIRQWAKQVTDSEQG